MTQITRSAATVCLFIVTTLAAAATYDWPQWQGPHRNGLTDETGLLKSWPEGGPRRLWLFDNCGAGYSGPSIVDGRLFTMGGRDGTSYLLALDANTGEELWAAPLGPMYEESHGDGPRATPTVEGGLVYALGGKGTLICARVADGREVWRVAMQDLGGAVPKWGYCESVLVDGGLVLCTPGGDQGAIAALEQSTGKLRWQSADLDDDAHYSSIIRAEIHGQPQYVQLLASRLVGLAPDDGRLLWQHDWPGFVAVIPTPIAHGDKVFCSSGYGVGCMLVEIGDDNEATQLYDDKTRKLMKNHHGGVIRIGDHLYGHSDGVGWLCMEFATGKQVWREKEALGKGSIAYADGMFYLISEDDGEVVLIDASPDGWQEHGRFTLEPQSENRREEGKFWTHPVIAGGKLFLRDQDLVYCYDVKAE